jgi:multidrug transporter EmrE-like cation transporter
MTKSAATFLSVTTGIVAVYLAVVPFALGNNASTAVDLAVVRAVWVTFGVFAIVAACFTFEALSEKTASKTASGPLP